MTEYVFTDRNFHNHERVNYFYDEELDLKVIIAIHSTKLGPALGGCRIYPYENEIDALKDVLRLSHGMTYKNALAGIPMGGGKAVIIGHPESVRKKEVFHKLAEFVNKLNGDYYTAADAGSTAQDMDLVHEKTDFVVGTYSESGDPSRATAYGVYKGILACVKFAWGRNNLKDIRIAVQGLGKVGLRLCEHISESGAKIIAADVSEENIKAAQNIPNIEFVDPHDIYSQDVDIFSPCAMGAIINDETIPMLKAKIVAGAANNQLHRSYHSQLLADHNILYAPDYLINSGGAIFVYHCKNKMHPDESILKADKIYDTLLEIFQYAQSHNTIPAKAANHIAEKRLIDYAIKEVV